MTAPLRCSARVVAESPPDLVRGALAREVDRLARALLQVRMLASVHRADASPAAMHETLAVEIPSVVRDALSPT